MIFMSIEQETDPETDKPTGRAILYAKIVTYDSVEDVDFIVENKKLISKLRSKIKPYHSFKALGRLVTRLEEEDVEVETGDDDDWGVEEDIDNKPSHVSFREMVITKVYPESIDKETYSKEVLASITQAEEDYGDEFDDDDDDDEIWD